MSHSDGAKDSKGKRYFYWEARRMTLDKLADWLEVNKPPAAAKCVRDAIAENERLRAWIVEQRARDKDAACNHAYLVDHTIHDDESMLAWERDYDATTKRILGEQ
jgi:hypothetical protein